MLIDMIMPKYAGDYKFVGNEENYPFQLTNQAVDKMKNAVNTARRKYISSSAFKGSFFGFDPRNSKSIYRSVDYIDFLEYNLLLYAPLFENTQVQDGISCLVRGVKLSLQF